MSRLKPLWHNSRLNLPVRFPSGDSVFRRIIGIQIGGWFIGAIKGDYREKSSDGEQPGSGGV